jgi:hypothetical protein
MKCSRAESRTLLTLLPGEPETDAWDSSVTQGTFAVIQEAEAADTECPDCQDVARDGHIEKEHIAGPNCERTINKGYSGWHIEAEEMRVSKQISGVCVGGLVGLHTTDLHAI